jgi:anionic cell wall polymer biosynthesis LytR-Cps2A-Psr (LCP) family protein
MVYEDDTLLFTILTQVDMDNTSYKVSVLKGSVVLDGSSLEQVLISSGEANALNAIESAIGTEFDYYISMESSDFEEFFDELGEVNFPVLNEIKYKEKESPVTYSLKLKAGEQKIDGKYFVNLIRYYLDVENNSSQANELVLASLSQQLNSENMEDSESLFKDFISVATTNITVRDFSLATDELTVLTSDEKGMNVYNAQAEFDGNEISEDSLKTVKGYFVK